MPPHYKRDLLLSIIERRLPSGSEAWKLVCQEYQRESGEATIRDSDDVKRHFHEKLCNKDQKPTGKSGDEKDVILLAQKIRLEGRHSKCYLVEPQIIEIDVCLSLCC